MRVLKFRPDQGQLYAFADDLVPRWLTKFTLLDSDTVAGLDKFENFFVTRLPLGAEDEAEDDPAATKHKWESGVFGGCAFKMDKICQFYIGEVGTGI